MSVGEVRTHRTLVVSTLGITQTLAWASTYYLPAVLADPIAADLHLSRTWFFGIFSGALLLSGLLGPLAGRMIDRRGGRDVLACNQLAVCRRPGAAVVRIRPRGADGGLAPDRHRHGVRPL